VKSSFQHRVGTGGRHWRHITGLPGWKRSQLDMPAFGEGDCHHAANPGSGQDAPRVRAGLPMNPAADASNRVAEAPPAAPGVAPASRRRSSIVLEELRRHAPFTALGTLTGIVVLAALLWTQAPRSFSTTLFWTLHPLHVVLSALVTTAMFRLHGGKGFWSTLGIGYLGSIGIATLSDCLLPYAGEWLLDLPHRGLHLGFIEKWWLVNPLAVAGIAAGGLWPHTRFPHAGHVLLSTWASLFHITMAMGAAVTLAQGSLIALFLFFSVWLPCCTSDIVFPLLFTPGKALDPHRVLTDSNKTL
jgi:hypothetical protein